MTDDLVTWLRAQLDVDERVARAAMRENPLGLTLCLHLPPEVKQHNDRHDPARVLRDVEAKRKILDMCAGWIAEPRVEDWEIDRAEELCLQNDAGPTLLRLLGLAYAGRDGYREEWRPE